MSNAIYDHHGRLVCDASYPQWYRELCEYVAYRAPNSYTRALEARHAVPRLTVAESMTPPDPYAMALQQRKQTEGQR
jgi:hypothetical protein